MKNGKNTDRLLKIEKRDIGRRDLIEAPRIAGEDGTDYVFPESETTSEYVCANKTACADNEDGSLQAFDFVFDVHLFEQHHSAHAICIKSTLSTMK